MKAWLLFVFVMQPNGDGTFDTRAFDTYERRVFSERAECEEVRVPMVNDLDALHKEYELDYQTFAVCAYRTLGE